MVLEDFEKKITFAMKRIIIPKLIYFRIGVFGED